MDARPGSPLYDKGMRMSVDLLKDIEEDIVHKRVP